MSSGVQGACVRKNRVGMRWRLRHESACRLMAPGRAEALRDLVAFLWDPGGPRPHKACGSVRADQRIAWVLSVVVWVVLGAASGTRAESFDEDFSTDPVAGGRWTLLDGQTDRFVYDPVAGTLTARYDTALPTARLVRGLQGPVTDRHSFRCETQFELKAPVQWSPEGLAQIAFGFLHRTLTGPDRTGSPAGDGNAYNVLSLDYFPNVSEWGGPTLSPTIINGDSGVGFLSPITIRFVYGQETYLDDPGEAPLPEDTPLTAYLEYAARTRQAVLRVAGPGGLLPINVKGAAGADGGSDGDPTTIITPMGGPGFQLDAFGLLLWQDGWAPPLPGGGLATTVKADVIFRRVRVEVDRPYGDFDSDGDVDVNDYAVFQGCFNGAGQPPPETCAGDADSDDDGDVDVNDFARFQTCFNGSGQPAAEGCE